MLGVLFAKAGMVINLFAGTPLSLTLVNGISLSLLSSLLLLDLVLTVFAVVSLAYDLLISHENMY